MSGIFQVVDLKATLRGQLLVLFLVTCFLNACDRNKPLSGIPENKSSFQKIVFTLPQTGNTISLISETQCEIANDSEILLAEYSREENKLRLVTRVGGTDSVNYFDITPNGLRSPNGRELLLPVPLQKFHEEAQATDQKSLSAKRDVEDAALMPTAGPMSLYTKRGIEDESYFRGIGDKAKLRQVQSDFKSLEMGLAMYKLNAGSFPTTEQGLNALVEKPTSTPVPRRWVQVMSKIPLDAWDSAYGYRFLGSKNADYFEITSKGPDSRENTADDLSSQDD